MRLPHVGAVIRVVQVLASVLALREDDVADELAAGATQGVVPVAAVAHVARDGQHGRLTMPSLHGRLAARSRRKLCKHGRLAAQKN